MLALLCSDGMLQLFLHLSCQYIVQVCDALYRPENAIASEWSGVRLRGYLCLPIEGNLRDVKRGRPSRDWMLFLINPLLKIAEVDMDFGPLPCGLSFGFVLAISIWSNG